MNGMKWTKESLLAHSSGYWSCCALQAGVQLNLFTALDNEPGHTASVKNLATRLNCDARGLSMLLTALAALGLIERTEESVRLPEVSRLYLSENSQDYVGFIVKHQAHIMQGWLGLADAVKTGQRTRHQSASTTPDEEEREAFLMGMFNIASNQAQQISELLDLKGKKKLLDLGGGPGTYAVFFCLAYPELRATVYDLPTSEPYARKVIRQYGLEERVAFIGGDFETGALPKGFDTIWVSHILHGESPEDARKLIAKAVQSLVAGGMLCIQEFIVDDDRQGPVHPALFGLNMLVGTEGGQAYTWNELSEIMREAGLSTITRIKAQLPQGCGILTGIRAS